MLYTRAGDKGTTKTFGCDQRVSKSSAIAEALGSLDEVNSFLGLCKVKGKDLRFKIKDLSFEEIIHRAQQNLFIVQAELAGAPKTIVEEKVTEVEELVDAIEKELPPIKTFFISGGTELAALFDVARTIARRSERRVVAVAESSSAQSFAKGYGGRSKATADKGRVVKIGKDTLAYLNRLSSLLYALARFSNRCAGIKEDSPTYK